MNLIMFLGILSIISSHFVDLVVLVVNIIDSCSR
jgi:hypothetical protein